jgi:hypothetical protein
VGFGIVWNVSGIWYCLECEWQECNSGLRCRVVLQKDPSKRLYISIGAGSNKDALSC